MNSGVPPGRLADSTLKLVLTAFESYAQINQANGEPGKNLRARMIPRVNKVIAVSASSTQGSRFFESLLKRTDIDLKAAVLNPVEERRARWTTYSNLKCWFGHWKNDLLELGFATNGSRGFDIPDLQLRRILNLDESCLSMDGSARRGGRPSVTFYDPNLPHSGKKTSKSSVTITFITGSTAFGEALPPHFQFSTKAKSDDKKKVPFQMVEFLKNVNGTFGARQDRVWPTTFGMNEKGGMDSIEFYKYITNSILPLYPDAANENGKRVIIKLDSGPGRLNMELLATLRSSGFILFPGVPNTTAVSQETDVSYGLFKSKFRMNLTKLTDIRIENNESVSFAPWIVGLLVFGGTDPITKCSGFEDCFALAFSKEKNIAAWEKVGAAPLTMACLSSDQVRQESDHDPLNSNYTRIQDANTLACGLLNSKGYDGNQLMAKLKKSVYFRREVTVPHSQERIEALSKAKTHGERFFVTGGSHATSDDVFKAAELTNRKGEIAAMEKDKIDRTAAQQRESLALAILQHEPPILAENLRKPQLQTILLWYGVQRNKQGKTIADVRAKYIELKEQNVSPEPYKKWVDSDEEILKNMKTSEIEMKDTALGRYEEAQRKSMKEAVRKMSQDERAEFMRECDGN